ncbi:helix-turn-helix domain-containing protein [Arthrobacter sp. H5]|uniref:helix-turn-helix domain-containing protein n=1 Tax=Arthrobacter sp. H5 TaxID=1267973 RepID=UPI0009E08E8D|nr:helix-turn-helix domain-containing protein [Arthrobacter sp. H5]
MAANPPGGNEEFLTVSDVAGRLSVSKMTVYRMIRQGGIPAHRFGRSYRISAGAVETYLHDTEIPRPPPNPDSS